MQVACSIAVAENALKFEHRDLHWGNILIARTTDPSVVYSLHGEELEVISNGLLVTIIDFTLSRMDNGLIFHSIKFLFNFYFNLNQFLPD